MKQQINITLNTIKSLWNPTGVRSDSQTFCMAVLPDFYNSDLCENQGQYFFNQPHGFAKSTLDAIMRGRRSANDPRHPAVGFSRGFLKMVIHNAQIPYLDHKKHVSSQENALFRTNMLDKIRLLIHSSQSPQTRHHPLFAPDHFRVGDDCTQAVRQAYANLHNAVDLLASQETEATLAYAVFLLVVAAIAQHSLPEAASLFAPDTVEQVIESDGGQPLVEVSGKKHIPFTDPHYQHPYRVYLFRESTNALYDFASLSMEPQSNGRTVATLNTRNLYASPVDGNSIFQRCFRGKPMLSVEDDCVYTAMSDDRDELLGILIFHYTPFRFASMYYRSGFWIRSAPETHRPQVQKVVITARELSVEELPYVHGLLKLDGKPLMLTQRQVDIFLESFKNEPWMPDFLQNYYPMFENHKKVFYCFDEDEILSCSVSDLPPMDRLRILLALKSVDPPSNAAAHKFVRCEDPTGTHSLMK